MENAKDFLVAFLVWAIDEHELICGDYNGDASVTYASDSYETIAERFLSEGAKNTEQMLQPDAVYKLQLMETENK